MKKGKRLLLLTAVIAVFIAGALVLKSMNAAREAADKAASAEEKPVVLTVPKDSMTEISYTNEGETLRFTKAGDQWQYAFDPAFPLNESKITAMADALSSLTASRKVADTLDQAEEYGLKTPSCTVTAAFKDGTKQTLYFGDKNSATNDTYVYVDGSQTVYTVASSVVSNFSSKLYGLIADEAFPTIDASSISNVAYTSTDKNLKLSYYPQSSDKSYSSMYTWFSEGENGALTPLDDGKISTYLEGVTGIAPTGTVDYDATQDELAAYGLDAPAATITMDYTVSHQESVPKATDAATPAVAPAVSPEADIEGTPEIVPSATTEATVEAAVTAVQASPSPTPEMVTITVTEPKQITIMLGKQAEDGSYYMRHSDSKRIFTISGDTYTKLTELAIESLHTAQICLIPIDTVEALSFTMDGKTGDFAIARTNTTDKDGKTTTDTVYKLGDAEIGESAFKSFYTTLISLEKEKTTDQIASGQPYITVTFHRNTVNFKEMTLTLYPYDSSFYMAEFNGESGMLVNKRDVEALVDAYGVLGS